MFPVTDVKSVLRTAALCAAVVMAVPAPAPAADANDPAFDAFHADFRAAVARRDEVALRRVMEPDFNFIRGTNVSWDKVFQGLAADGGRQWANLEQAVQGQASVVPGKGEQRPTRALRCTPTDAIYNCLVVFTLDRQDRWRWQGMIMPLR